MTEIAYCKIFPPVGIARVGDSQDDDGWFYGPENPDAPAHSQTGFTFRDAAGRIKRQAARFRIYAFNKEGVPIGELTDASAKISWNVSLANKKAAWLEFRGTRKALNAYRGADDAPRPRNARVGTLTRNEEGRYAPSTDRAKALEIHGGTKTICGKDVSSKGTPEYHFLGRFKDAVDVYLGELRTDEDGRLIVLGGRGLSEAVSDSGVSIRGSRWIRNYANNDDWHDDVSDGPVTAEVTLRSTGQKIAVKEGAWIIVAPPDFAPDINNVVSLYDVLEEVAFDEPALVGPDSTRPRGHQRPDFAKDIEPLLRTIDSYRWVNARGLRGHGYQKPGDFQKSGKGDDLNSDLSNPDPNCTAGRILREKIFSVIRAPAYQRGPDKEDSYGTPIATSQATGVYMPPLAGDEGDPVAGDPSTWLSVTYLQYERLRAWKDGLFTRSDDAVVAAPSEKVRQEIDSLTRATLGACAGGAFYPGIELTCIARERSLYCEAFRLNHAKLEAGDLTKYMAVPWQADFWECREHWWPAQRPDDIIPEREFEELFGKFTEEVSGSYREPLERVLFNRKRWDRGIGGSSRPSLAYITSRLLPDPQNDATDTYIDRLSAIASNDRAFDPISKLLISLTPLRDVLSAADDESSQADASRLKSPWRLHFLCQSALDAYSGLYFHPRVPAPEDVLKTDALQLGARTLGDVRREWNMLRTATPKEAFRVSIAYAKAVVQDLAAQVRVVLLEHPKGRVSAAALRDSLQSTSVDELERLSPHEFDASSSEYKELRAVQMLQQMSDLLYQQATVWAGDMDMVNMWSQMGFVVSRRRTAATDSGEPVTVSTQVETERPRYDGLSFRDYFYILMNIEEYPDFAPFAKQLAKRFLDNAQKLVDEKGIYDPQHPESFVAYSPESFAAKLEEIYEILRGQALSAEGWRTGRTHDEWIRAMVDSAPFNQTDGTWLRYVANAGPTEQVRSFLFEVWSDEVGNGNPALHHGNLFTVLLASLGQYLPAINSRSYADNPAIHESRYIGAVFQLAISLHSEEFFPELLGMTLFLEWEVLSLVPGIKGRDYMGIDSQFWRMHVGIDNASNGHGAKARAAVEMYLDHVFKEGGDPARQEEWSRIWRGFVAFATAGYEFFQNKDNQDDVSLQRAHLPSPEERVKELMSRKAHYGQLNHRDSRLGGHRLNDLFEEPDMFVAELANSPWIVPGDPDGSRFINNLTTFTGPMYKVFNQDDLALWREWILWLGRDGDTATPKRYVSKADSMLMLLAELRELARGADGHRRYRLAHPGRQDAVGATNGGRQLIAQFFEEGDLMGLMRALRDPENGWAVPFNPGASPIVLDVARADRPMGRALDQRFPSLGNQIGRDVLVKWIAAGCPIPGEVPPTRDAVRVAPKWEGRRLLVQQLGPGAVH